MENEELSQKEIVKFFYQKSRRRPRRLENNIFVIYSPEKIKLQPGEMKFVNKGVKIKFSKNITGSCTTLQSLSNYVLKLLNSNTISQEFNSNTQNFLTVNENDLRSWTLILELYNKSFTWTLQIRKRQEIGYFFITNNGGKELDFKYVKVL